MIMSHFIDENAGAQTSSHRPQSPRRWVAELVSDPGSPAPGSRLLNAMPAPLGTVNIFVFAI